MKRWISVLIVLSLAFLISGCQAGRGTGEPTPETQIPASSEQETPAEPQQEVPELPAYTSETPADPEPSETSEDTEDQADPEAPASTEEDRAALIAVLDQIRAEARVGVAGSSLTAVQLASVLLDWGMETPLTEEEIQDIAQSWYAGLESADQEEFEMQLSGVDGAVDEVLAENGPDLLDSAGCTESAYPWNDAARTAAKAVSSAILAEE